MIKNPVAVPSKLKEAIQADLEGMIASSKTQTGETQQKNTDNALSIEITPGDFCPLLKGRQTWTAMKNGTSISATYSTIRL